MIVVMPWWSLRMHAGYRCRHAGVCCRADWEIPVESHVLAAVDASRLRSSAAGRRLMAGLSGEVELQVPRRADRACLFYEPRPQGLTQFPSAGPDPISPGSCAIHREAGEGALPTACRHFPREIVIDPRGTLVSLSHYCPTAAALLTQPSALEVVEAHVPLVIGEPIDGLDARECLPPLIRPGLLSDSEGYAAWESACLAILSRADLTGGQALDAIAAMTERVRTWSPALGPLAPFVRASTDLRLTSDSASTELRLTFDSPATHLRGTFSNDRRIGPEFAEYPGGESKVSRSSVDAESKLGRGEDEGESKVSRSAGGRGAGRRLANDFAALIAQHVPEEAFPVADYEERWAPLVEGSPAVELVIRNYLGARVFANWIAYQGQGLRTIVEWLRACYAVIRSEIALGLKSDERPATAADAVAAAGRADLLMVHTVDSQTFADFFADDERG